MLCAIYLCMSLVACEDKTNINSNDIVNNETVSKNAYTDPFAKLKFQVLNSFLMMKTSIINCLLKALIIIKTQI